LGAVLRVSECMGRYLSLIFLFSALFNQAALAQAADQRLVFSTFHGGDRNDDAQAVAVDAAGNIYVTGETESRDLKADPVGGKPLTLAVFKSYLTKYEPGGKKVAWRLLIGGSSNTVTHALCLDAQGNVYIAGTSGARDLPMLNAVQAQQTGLNIAFLMKFDPQGKLLFSTYFGGDRNEEGNAIAVDSRGNIYLAGRASSTKLPVKNALQPVMGGGGQDAFIAKYTPDYQLAYATYFGGTAGTDNIRAIAVGPDDSLFVTGDSMSPGLATENAYIRTAQAYSGYLAKIDPDGQRVAYCTYIGWRTGYTVVRGLAVDAQGRAYVVGHTSSKDLKVTPNALQPVFAGGFRDGFVLRMNAAGSDAEVLTYLGGGTRGAADPDEVVQGVAVDAHGHVYVTGETVSPDFPGRRVVQPVHGGAQDSFVMRLDLDQNQIIYATFWGGAKRDGAYALALGPGENVTIVGESYSENLPLKNAVQSNLGSLNDAFVAQICDPWLGAQTPEQFRFVRGQEGPAPAQEIVVWTGCEQPFDATEVVSDQPWLKVAPAGKTVPMRLGLTVDAAELEPGEHKAVIRVTVPEAYQRTIEIPVVLEVVDPPPPPPPAA